MVYVGGDLLSQFMYAICVAGKRRADSERATEGWNRSLHEICDVASVFLYHNIILLSVFRTL